MPQRRVKSTGAKVLKSLMKATRDLDKKSGDLNTKITLKSSADFTDLKTITKKYPEAAKKAHLLALGAVAEELELALGIAMESKDWGTPDWPYGDGDIVQTGRLRDSLELRVTEEGIAIMYSAINPSDGFDYAAMVYFGGYIQPYGNPYVKVYMPGRPWIKGVLLGGGPVDKFDFTGTYKTFFEKYMIQQAGDVEDK
jgi:hypothetical protein